MLKYNKNSNPLSLLISFFNKHILLDKNNKSIKIMFCRGEHKIMVRDLTIDVTESFVLAAIFILIIK
jgi:hypothetical protein